MANKLVKIEIVQNFKSHDLSCYATESRFVDSELAQYFVDNGWAKYPDGSAKTPDLSEKTLEVQDGKHMSGSTEPV